MLEENVVGFYDDRPEQRRLYAVSEERTFTPMNQIVLAHEMRHALQDQYADLHAQLTESECDFDDRRLAVLSLYEGDATLVMERFLQARLGPLGALGAGVGEGDGSGAAALRGAGAVRRARARRRSCATSWCSPTSPGWYWRALCGTGRRRRAARGLGESPSVDGAGAASRALPAPRGAASGVAARRAARAARRFSPRACSASCCCARCSRKGGTKRRPGWGGDGWRLWDVRGRTVLSWRSEWDTPARAGAFHDALRQRFTQRLGPSRTEEGWEVFESDRGRWFGVRREDDAVELVTADDAPLFAAVLRPNAGAAAPRSRAGSPRLTSARGRLECRTEARTRARRHAIRPKGD